MSSPVGIKSQISEIMKTSLKSGDKDTLAYARNLHAAVRKKEIDDRADLDDAGVQKIIQGLLKQRLDSIDQFTKGGRDDLVQKETAELEFLKKFLPAPFSDEELKSLVKSVIQEVNAQSAKDLGLVMKSLQPKLQGRADGKRATEMIRSLLPN